MIWWREYMELCHDFADTPGTRANMQRLVLPLLKAHRKGIVSCLQYLREFGFRGPDDAWDELRTDCRDLRQAICTAMRRLRELESGACNPTQDCR